MWQVDNDRYYLRHLEHELRSTPIDELLNRVTVSDRSEASALARRIARLPRRMMHRLAGWLDTALAGANRQTRGGVDESAGAPTIIL